MHRDTDQPYLVTKVQAARYLRVSPSSLDRLRQRGALAYPITSRCWRRKPSRRNPRLHSDAQIAAIAGSIAACAIQLLILSDTGAVITEALRLRAARDIGLGTVPVIESYHGECHAN